MPETWGECGVCNRWFYCERDATAMDPGPVCPVCGERPVQVAPSPPSADA